MTSYQIYQYVSLGSLIACGIFLAIAVALFFTLRIPKVISDLSGRTQRRAIEDIRRRNEEGGEKIYQSSAVNRERGKLTDKISRSGRLMPRDTAPIGGGAATEKIGTQQLTQEAGETALLDQEIGETALLDQEAGETALLSQETGETALLSQETSEAAAHGETSRLAPTAAETAQPASAVQGFAVEYEITFIHTDEVIT